MVGLQKKRVRGKLTYGDFKIGLCLFDPKTGKIPWISEKPLIEDPNAKHITFASDFLRTSRDQGLLYAHVDDSFIRAYRLNAKELKQYLPQSIKKREK